MISGSTAIARAMHSVLLAAGQAGAGIVQPVLHLLDQACATQAEVHDLGQVRLALGNAVDARPVGDILEDGLGKRVGLLEHHAHARPELHWIELGVVDVLVVDRDLAGDAATGDRIVHAVDAAQERRLAATRGANEGHHALFGNVDRDVLERVLLGVVDVDIPGHDRPRCPGLRQGSVAENAR
jgi:hypothetical protein